MIIKNDCVFNVQTSISCIVAHIELVNMTDICLSTLFCCFSTEFRIFFFLQAFKSTQTHYHCAGNGANESHKPKRTNNCGYYFPGYYVDRQTDKCGASIKHISLISCPSWSTWIMIIVFIVCPQPSLPS